MISNNLAFTVFVALTELQLWWGASAFFCDAIQMN